MPSIDFNSDMGESFGVYQMGADLDVLRHVTSANIACGFHAGDPRTISRTVDVALKAGVAIGAHPGFNDLLGFGRRAMHLDADEIYDITVYQIGAVKAFAEARGGRLAHVKAHGALYNMAARNRDMAAALCAAVRDVDRSLIFLWPVGLATCRGCTGSGFALCGGSIRRSYLSGRRLADATRSSASDDHRRRHRSRTGDVDGRTPPGQVRERWMD